LTELPNRALFRERLGHAIESGHERLAVALIDLKGFRALNDSFGAEGGDVVLQQTAQRLANALPEGDTVARPGGDEFWVLMEDLPRNETVEQRLWALNQAVSEPLTVAEQTVRLEAHMGVALYPEDGTDREGMLTSAATALHRAQGEGETRIQYFHPGMDQAVQHRVRLAEALKGALEQDELEVWYQAKVNLASGSSTGLEALVRWRHPDWGLISPAEFIPLAEETR
ncbi:MAG: diguanylate cyclase domain-containing protein, partial [Thiohalorhabdaceae bacterium]